MCVRALHTLLFPLREGGRQALRSAYKLNKLILHWGKQRLSRSTQRKYLNTLAWNARKDKRTFRYKCFDKFIAYLYWKKVQLVLDMKKYWTQPNIFWDIAKLTWNETMDLDFTVRDGAKTYADKLLIDGRDTTIAHYNYQQNFQNLDYIKQVNICIKVFEILIKF